MKNFVIKVLIADDNPIIREKFKQIIAEAPDIRVNGEAENGQQLLELIRKDKWDVVLLDINMPVKGGIATLKELKKESLEIPVIIVSVHPETEYFEAAKFLENFYFS